MARFSPTDEAFEPPRPVTNVAEFIDKREALGYVEIWQEKLLFYK